MATTALSGTYPLQFEAARPPSQSRLLGFPLGIGSLIRGIMLIPHFVVLYALGIALEIVIFIAQFGILFTGRWPRGLFDFSVGVTRWQALVYAYLYKLTDRYPPFSFSQQADYPILYQLDYQEGASRILNFPLLIGTLIRSILLIPHLVAIVVLAIAFAVVSFIAGFAILFTGAYPEGMYGFGAGFVRWSSRVFAYLLGLTDRYPPFSLSA